MTMHLEANFGCPLEREYEAWIVAGIERHFSAIGVALSIWAIGPKQEVVWPADEKLWVNSKVVGLQFKQAKIANGKSSPDALHWSLHQPSPQFQRVLDNKEIYYCLPTFINRKVRGEALHHCLFWRPDGSKLKDKNVWYSNPRARTTYNKVSDCMRWGLFSERLFECSIGTKVKSLAEAQVVERRISSFVENEYLSLSTPRNEDGNGMPFTPSGEDENRNACDAGRGLYLLVFPIEG